MCHLDLIFPSRPYICPSFNENHVWVHVCILYPVYFEVYHTCDPAGSLAFVIFYSNLLGGERRQLSKAGG